jgi:hypothetical protein
LAAGRGWRTMTVLPSILSVPSTAVPRSRWG